MSLISICYNLPIYILMNFLASDVSNLKIDCDIVPIPFKLLIFHWKIIELWNVVYCGAKDVFFSPNQQTVNAMSQISFSTDETVSSHKKPTSLAEVAKQRELTGSLLSESDDRLMKQLSDAKCKELSGHDIFAAPEVLPRSSGWNLEMNDSDLRETTPRNLQSPVKVPQVGI